MTGCDGVKIRTGDEVECIHNPSRTRHTVSAVYTSEIVIDGSRRIDAAFVHEVWRKASPHDYWAGR